MPVKKTLLSLFLLSLFLSQPSPVFAQPGTVSSDTVDGVFSKVEIEASFPGGYEGWAKFLQKNLKADTPVKKGAKAGTYTVIVQFVVDREGNVTDLKALTHHGFGMEEEVLRVLNKSPKWSPAQQEGKLVRAYRKQPVTFVVVEEEKKRKNKND